MIFRSYLEDFLNFLVAAMAASYERFLINKICVHPKRSSWSNPLHIQNLLYRKTRGNSLIFFRTPSLKSQKNHIQNHKIIRKITYRKHQKSQITEKLLKNHAKKLLEITKITKNHISAKREERYEQESERLGIFII